MKLTKLMLTALVAVFTMVSCSKEMQTPEDTTLKTVQVSLKNIVMTKGLAGDKIESGNAVKVKNFKIFLTDGSYTPGYSAKNADGTPASFYFDSADDLTDLKEFHFVDHKCTKIVVVANVGDKKFEDIMNLNVGIENQQNQNELVLYGEQDLTPTNRTHTVQGTEKYTEVYEAKVTLKPTIARFEVDGFVTKFSATPKFNKVSVTAIAFQHYFPFLKANTNGGKLHIAGTEDHVLHVQNLDNESDVFGWFNGSSSNGWFIDRFSPALDMTPADNKADVPNPLAYHFYAGEAVPQMMITVLVDSSSPSYIYTSKFKHGSGYLTQLEAGKIYRMNAAGEVGTDGSIEIPDDFTPIQRCLEVEVEVVDWVIDIITPEF